MFSDRMEPFFIDRLERQLQLPLPGRDAQFRMAHITRQSYNGNPPSDAKLAGVLALFYPNLRDQWHLVLIERESHNPKDRHRGQISFPGGQFDKADASLAHTALREAEEEIGVCASSIRLLGQLTPLYIPVSNFHVFPFVGVAEHRPAFQIQPEEVKSILEVPFQHFTSPGIAGTTTISLSESLQIPNVPFFDVEGKAVWGATAMILSELLAIVEPG